MKKHILAMAALCACVSTASAQSSVVLYGIIDAGLTSLHNDGPAGRVTKVDTGQMQVSRWGLRGQEDLGGGMKARFGLEGTLLNDTGGAGVGFGTPTSTSLFDREATVGISGKYGAIDAGRQNIVGIMSVGMADPLGLGFASSSPNVLFSAMNNAAVYGPYGANNGGTALRQNNSIKYSSPVFNGLSFAVMRAFGEQAGDHQKSSYQGGALLYNTGKFTAAGAYARMKNVTNTDLLTSHAYGIKYAFPAVTLKSTYSMNELRSTSRKIAVLGVGADVPVAQQFLVTAAFYNTKRSGDLVDDSQQYILIGRYLMSKRTTGYVSIGRAVTDDVVQADQINLAQNFVAVGSDSATRFTMGIMHMF
ncbi:porin [Massilia sp. YIM B02443]|uniref:porin n=1 Tax=Massilia sp. YIM B02443 TaxID=3050127 RepID=UPI0025B6899D|nr:porin [Massilia sp. YIM B02443]